MINKKPNGAFYEPDDLWKGNKAIKELHKCTSITKLKKMLIDVVVLQLQANFQTVIVLCSRFIWIKNSSDIASGLGNYFVCKRFAVQTFLWSLEFVIHINLKHKTIAV